MILDYREYDFENCPTCKGLAIWLNDHRLTPTEANRRQAIELVDFIDNDDDCQRLNITVTRKERKRCKV